MAPSSKDLQQRMTDHFERSAALKRQLTETCGESILEAAERISSCFRQGGKLLLCGNGGSAADSQHFATELVVRLSSDFERQALPAIALTTDTSLITACANDYGFEHVFSRQVEAVGREGDALIGISTSGGSKNVVLAMEAAKKRDMKIVAWTGEKDGPCAELRICGS